MDWKTYREELAQARFDPAFQQRVLRELDALAACRKEKHIMNRMTRYALIAALLVLVIGISAFAAVYTAHDTARDFLGISRESPIPEYTEFPTSPTETTAEVPALPQPRLLSTVCSGGTVIANVEFSPIEESWMGHPLSDLSEYYALDLDGTGFSSWNMEIISYDRETKAALAKITLLNATGENIHLNFRMEKDFMFLPEIMELDVPVSMGDGFTATLSAPLRSEVGEGMLCRAEISAMEVQVTYTVPGFRAWEGYVAYDESKREAGEFQAEYWDAYRTYTYAWFDAADKLLQDAALEFAGGESSVILDLPSDFSRFWAPPENGSLDAETSYTATRAFRNPLDLRTVTGITIAGVTYPLSAE